MTHCDSAILHSKITPALPQIRNFQNHAYGTYFLYWALPNNFSTLPHSPPKTEGDPALRSLFFVLKVNITYQWPQLG